MREFLILCIIIAVLEGIGKAIKDSSAVIRFFGYAVALIVAIALLWLVLYFYFDINLLNKVISFF